MRDHKDSRGVGEADPTASRSARPPIVDGRRGNLGSMGKPEVAPGPRETFKDDIIDWRYLARVCHVECS